MATNDRERLTTRQTAERLGVQMRTVYSLINREALRYVDPERHLLDAREVETALAQKRKHGMWPDPRAERISMRLAVERLHALPRQLRELARQGVFEIECVGAPSRQRSVVRTEDLPRIAAALETMRPEKRTSYNVLMPVAWVEMLNREAEACGVARQILLAALMQDADERDLPPMQAKELHRSGGKGDQQEPMAALFFRLSAAEAKRLTERMQHWSCNMSCSDMVRGAVRQFVQEQPLGIDNAG